MQPLSYYLRAAAILRDLARQRVKVARRRRERDVHAGVFGGHESLPDELDAYFPPRSSCVRFTREQRRGRRPHEVQVEELEHTLAREVRLGTDVGVRLGALIQRVRARALSFQLAPIRPEEIRPVPKKSGGTRPIARYSLEDGIIDRLYARYLRDLLDGELHDGSCAFRKPGRGTHHDVVKELLAYRKQHAGKALHVAEIDLRSAFDAACQTRVLWRFFQMFVVASWHHRRLDVRALLLCVAFVLGYSLSAASLAGCTTVELERKIVATWGRRSFRWIGLAQGSALSGTLLNVLLDRFDRAVAAALGPDGFYRRFVDDVIMLHSDPARVEAAFRTALQELDRARMLAHEPAVAGRYGADHWGAGQKTRGPYGWSSSRRLGHAPWVGFLGYQIRQDGMIRIRRSSVEKELEKQKKFVDDLVAKLRRGKHATRSAKSIMAFARGHLQRMAVGDVHRGGERPAPVSFSAGFKALLDGERVRDQLRVLDRGREQQLARLRRALAAAPDQMGPRRTGPITWAPTTRSHGSYYRQLLTAAETAPAVPIPVLAVRLNLLSSVVSPRPTLVRRSRESRAQAVREAEAHAQLEFEREMRIQAGLEERPRHAPICGRRRLAA